MVLHSNHSINFGNSGYKHYLVMFIIMILSGMLSTMNIWVDKFSDIRFSLNDLYMILLMTGWMFLFMGIYYMNYIACVCGIILVVSNIWAIRSQFLVSISQYKLGMIPHHSMAIHMSKKLLVSGYNISSKLQEFLKQLIETQSNEIDYLKNAN